MNCVSYEIACRLKKAGFPKPEQLLSSATRGWVYATQLPGGINAFEARIPLRESYLFAPSIADILQLIPDFFVKASNAGFGFYCARLDPTTAKWSKNIHDAAALAWLALNEKK